MTHKYELEQKIKELGLEIASVQAEIDDCEPIVDTYRSPAYTEVVSMSNREEDLHTKLAQLTEALEAAECELDNLEDTE